MLEFVQLQGYQKCLHYYQQHIELLNEFLLIYTQQGLLHMPHPLF